MSIGRPDFGRVYTQQELAAKKDIEIEQNNNCQCTEKVWPSPDNPPAPPVVPARPYPPEFLPLPPDVAYLTVDKDHTSATVHNCDSHEDIYHYTSAATANDINTATYNTLVSALAYTDNRFAYYDEDEVVSGQAIKQRKIVRYKGKVENCLPEIVDSLKNCLYQISGFSLSTQQGILSELSAYQIFKDLRVGDLFISPISSEVSSKFSLSAEYICTKAYPLSAIEFERLGNASTEEIEKALIQLEASAATSAYNAFISAVISANNYTDEEIKKLGNIFTIKGFMLSSTYEQQFLRPYEYIAYKYAAHEHELVNQILKDLKTGNIYFSREEESTDIAQYLYILNSQKYQDAILSSNWEKLGTNAGYALSADVVALVKKTAEELSAYTDYVSGILEASAAASAVTLAEESYNKACISANTLINAISAETLISANAYTNAVSSEFASILTGKLIEQLSGTMIYQGYATNNKVTETPWQYVLEEISFGIDTFRQSLKNGQVFIVNEEITTSDDFGKLTSTIITAQYMYIAPTQQRLTAPSSSTAWLKLGDGINKGHYATVNYVNNIVSASLVSTIIETSKAASSYTDFKVLIAKSELSTYAEDLVNKETSARIVDVTSARTDLTNYVNTEITSARTDLSTYVEVTSSNIINYISAGIKVDFDGLMIYNNYVCTDPFETPWEHAKHLSGEPGFLQKLYKGDIYIVNEYVFGRDTVGEITTSVITAQYMYIAETAEKETAAKLSTSWLKLGYTTNLNDYANINYVNTKLADLSTYIIIISGSTYAYTDAKVASARIDLSAYVEAASGNAYAYTDSSVNSARTDLSAYVDTETTARETAVSEARTDLSAYVEAASGNAYAYTDSSVNSARTDLSTYVDVETTARETAVSEARTDLSAYIETVSGNAYAYTDSSVNSARTDLSAYVDTETTARETAVSVARTDLSAYIEAASGNAYAYTDSSVNSARTDLSAYVLATSGDIIKTVSAGIKIDFDGLMIYEGYASNNNLFLTPWNYATIIQPGSDFIKHLYKGKVYIVNENIFGRDEIGEITTSVITAQYMYIAETDEKETASKLSTSWLKLGYTINLNDYANINYVNNIVSASLSNAITQEIKNRETAISATRADLSAYVDAETSARINDVNVARADLSTYVDAETSARINDVNVARADLSTYVDAETSACINDINVARADLSAYVDAETSARINDVNVARADLSAYVDTETSARINDVNVARADLSAYVDAETSARINDVNVARADLSAYVDAETSARINDVNAARADLSAYVDTETSARINDVNAARADLSAYVDTETSARINDVNVARADLSAYVDTETIAREVAISAARTDLSTYVEVTSSNIINYISAGIKVDFDGLMIYNSYACTNLFETPWEHASHLEPSATFIKHLYKGDIYIVNEYVFGRDTVGEITTSVITAQYMYIAETAEKETAAKLSTSWLKLGYTTNLNDYANNNYVNTKLADLSTNIDIEISNREIAVNTARIDLSAYIDAETAAREVAVNATRTDLSAYVDNETSARINDVNAARTDLSAYIDAKAISLVGKDAISISGDLNKTAYLTIDSNDKYLTQSVNGLLTNIGISSVAGSTSGEIAKTYFLTGKDGQKIVGTEIDIPKDRAISGITYNQTTKKLTLVVYTATGSTASTVIDLSGLIDVYNAASGIAKVDNTTFVGIVDNNSENYLTVSKDGFKLAGINNAVSTASTNAYTNAITVASSYTDIVSSNLQNNIDINTNKLVGINDTVTSYVSNEISGVITYISGHIMEDCDGLMIYEGYVCNDKTKTYEYPWQHASHFETSATFIKQLYKGKVYIVNENISGRNELNEIVTNVITAQYMYISETSARITDAKLQSSWLKIGYTTNLNDYANINYVNNIISSSLADAINTEVTARETADNYLSTSIESVSGTLNTAITNEASARETADNYLSTSIESVSGTLNTAITNEASARETADSQLSTSIESVSGTLNTTITNEASARETADSQLSTSIESVSGTLNTAINNEASARETADSQLSTAIESVSGTLNTAITNEASARETADNIIQNQISSAFGEGAKVIISKDNSITKSQVIIGGATLADTALSTTLATEAAVRNAIDTKAIGLIGKDAIGISGSLEKVAYLTIDGNDKYLTQSVNGLLTNIGISSVAGSASGEVAKTYFLIGKDGQKIAGTEIDIPKDRAISGIAYDQTTKKLTLVVYTATGSTASTVIDLSGLIDVYNAASGIAKVDNNTFVGVVDGNSESYLTVNKNGFLLSGINDAISAASANAYNIAKFYTNTMSSNLQANIDLNTNKLVGIDDTVTGYVTTEIGKIIVDVPTLTGRIQTIETTISGTNGLITKVTDNTNKLAGIDTTVTAYIENISSNLINYTSTTIATTSAVITSIIGEQLDPTSSVFAEINALKTMIGDLQTSITEYSTTLANIKDLLNK